MAYPSTVIQIEGRIRTLATTSAYSTFCRRFELPNRTYEGTTGGAPGRVVGYLRIGTGTGGGRPRILIVAGLHGREFAPPDAILTFTAKLLDAYATRRAIVYGPFDDTRTPPTIRYKRFTIDFPTVQRIIERTELYILPLANPDGRAFAQSDPSRKLWRKNRRPAPAGVTCPPGQSPVGVDLNRNFDAGWDFAKYFSAAAVTALNALGGGRLGVSDDPCDPQQVYQGPRPVSGPHVPEPEVRNIQQLLNDKNVNFYMDVHSAAGQILFPWCLEQNQDAEPKQTFKNPHFDRAAAGTGGRDAEGTAYGEWMPPGMEPRHRQLAESMRDAILDSTGFTALDAATRPGHPADPMAVRARAASLYEPMQSLFSFGRTTPDFETGGSDDFAFSRQIGTTGSPPDVRATALDPILSFTFESGRDTDGGFHPNATTTYPKIEREIGAALGFYFGFVATHHAPVPPAPPPAPGRSWCFIATAAYGSPLHPKVRYLCDLRDDDVKTTRFGKRFMHEVDRVYYSFSPQVAAWLRRHRLARSAVRLCIAEPWIAIVRGSVALTRPIPNAELRAGSFLGLVVFGTLAAILAMVLLLYVTADLLAGFA